jgi:hypothetical protein
MAAVIDCGKYYEVEYLTTSLNKDFETNKKFLGLSLNASKLIKKSLDENKTIRITSDYKNIDVQPHDLIITETSDIESYKKVMLSKVRQLVTHQQANVSGMMMYEYMNINNILNDKGYFIHDDNKEEVYLQILETGDEDLINNLEDYLNAREVISRASFLEKRYIKLYRNVNESLTEEEVDKLINDFIIMMNDVRN